MHKFTLLILIQTLCFFGCNSIISQSEDKNVLTGIDVLEVSGFDYLKGKKVGLITNPTGVNAQLISTADIFHKANEVNLVALFGPEHGVRGNHNAGNYVESRNDPETGIPVYSLYGKTRKPNPKMLKDIDILVYDIQDIGARSYTYISTMGKAMEAAAENNIEFVILDRPNPLGGLKIEGPIAESKWFSIVGAYPIPYLYGLTVGELAQMINEEGWLKDGVKCKLKVIKMINWERNMHFKDTGLHWVPSSPHIPDAEKAPYYASTGILGELGVFNIGVGYTLPFELIGSEFINPALMAQELNDFYKGNVIFRSISYKPYYGGQASKMIHGFQLYIINPDDIDLLSIQFKFLEVFHKIYPSYNVLEQCKDRHNMFDKVNGTSRVREMFFKNYKYEEIEELMKNDVISFRQQSSKYHLYK